MLNSLNNAVKWKRKAAPLDLNVKLLAMFDAVYHTRSISLAAERLGMSQPGVSIGLAKLRKHFGDALFVRTAAGMEPTAHAQHIAPMVEDALSLVSQALGYIPQFEPGTTKRMFRICMTDVTQMLLLPDLLQRFSEEAPAATMEILRLERDTHRALASGDADVAIGLLPGLGADYREQTLVKRSFACIASVSHPRICHSISLLQFESEPQLVIQARGTGLSQAEQLLARRKGSRHVRLRVPDFVGVAALVSGSDMIATVPREVGQRMALQGGIKVLDHPVRMPTYLVKQYWHQRFNRDPGSMWLRGMLKELLLARTR